MPLEEHLQGKNSKQMQVDTASTDPMRPREGIAYMLQDPENEPLEAERFVRALQQSGGGLNAVSLGYSDTLTSISGVSTSSEIPEEERQRIGVAKGLVRLSVGFEGDRETEWSKISRAAHHATAR